MKEADRKSVLIVEDDRDIRHAIMEVLDDNDYPSVGASNGREALERLRSLTPKPGLILLDIMMPVMDGWAFRQVQKQDPELQFIPVIVMTAHANGGQAAQEMNVAGLLKKPVTLELLLETVQKYV